MAEITFGKNVLFVGMDIRRDGYAWGTDYPYNPSSEPDKATIYSYVGDKFTQPPIQTAIYLYDGGTLTSDQYSIYRRSKYSTDWEYLGNVQGVQGAGVRDYNVGSNTQYRYLLEPNPKSATIVDLTVPQYTYNMWESWSLVDCQYNNEFGVYQVKNDSPIYFFENNISVGTYSDNLKIIRYETLGKFNKIIRNNQNFASSTLSVLFEDFYVQQNIQNGSHLIYNINQMQTSSGKILQNENEFMQFLYNTTDGYFYSDNQDTEESGKIFCKDLIDVNKIQNYNNVYLLFNEKYYACSGQTRIVDSAVINWKPLSANYCLLNDHDKLEAWKQFIANDSLKLLKSPDGGVWIVTISDANSVEINYQSGSYPSTISFNWIEVVDTKNVSILGWD